MKQHITDPKTGIAYTFHGEYYLPDLSLPAKEEIPIGVGSAHEFNPKPRNGNRKSRIDLCLNEMLPGMSRRYIGQ